MTPENKIFVIDRINKLEASGLTNGGEGLKMAFELVEEHFSDTANNQVILSTDGGLNSYMKHSDVLEMVHNYNDKVRTSLLMLKGYKWTVKYMTEIAQAGKGHLLMIKNMDSASEMLIKEIKANSFIQE